MKLLRLILPFLLSLLCLTWLSCSDSDDASSLPPGTPHLQLCCTTGSMAQTRAVVSEPGVEAYNENIIHSLDVFLFPLAATEAEQAASPLVYHHHFDGINAQGTHEITDYILSKGTINALTDGATKTQCYAYVVANSTADVAQLPAEATLTDVKELDLAVAASFVEVDWAKRLQQDFVMTGEAAINFEASSVKLSGTVELKRVAAKLEFEVTNVTSEVYDEGNNLWIPHTEDMYIRLIHGVKHTRVGGVMDKADDDYFELNGFLQLTKSGSTWPQDYPFYSYPADWTDGNDQVAYVMLTVPWGRVENDENGTPKKDGEGNYVIAGNKYITTYYQIPIGENAKAMLSNAYYRMKIDVGIIGSFDPTLPVTLTDNSYIIVDWSEGTILPIAMKKVSYLAVAENTVEMNNVNKGSVAYVSSEEVNAEVVEVSFIDYTYKYTGSTSTTKNQDIPETITLTNTNTSYTFKNRSSVTVKLSDFTVDMSESGFISLKHDLSADDYVPYTVKVHITNEKLEETVTFTQYPPIYIVGNRSTAGSVHVNEDNNTSSTSWEYVHTASSVDGSGNNNNRYLYAIHISSLSDNSYMLGDVRESTVTTFTDTYLYKMTNYHRTKTTDEVKSMIPPAILIASSYGKTYATSYNNQVKRCASYQEDGYYAGRWRIPTEAEIKFIVNLSKDGVIPQLFDGEYFASSQRAYSSDDGNFVSSGSYAVRCVYDLWYWGDEHSNKNFTWGD